MRVINYYKAEYKGVEDRAFPYYVRKCTYIMYKCFRRVDLEDFFKGLRKALSKGTTVAEGVMIDCLDKYIAERLIGGYVDAGYLIYDITSFFQGLLERYTVPRILEALENPDLYADFRPDKNFKLFPGEPDYLKKDYGQFI